MSPFFYQRNSMIRFSDALARSLAALPNLTPNQTQVSQMLRTSHSALPHKALVLASLEQVSRAAMGIDPAAPIDWSGPCPCSNKAMLSAAGTIDWAALLAFLEQILAVVLPLIP
jgi:hypothetical protein